jgi:hypothetical protein
VLKQSTDFLHVPIIGPAVETMSLSNIINDTFRSDKVFGTEAVTANDSRRFCYVRVILYVVKAIKC